MKNLKFVLLFLLTFMMSMTSYSKNYGITSTDAIKMAVNVVPHLFEENHEKWEEVLIGTLAAETRFGQFKAGSKLGIGQVTKVAHKMIKENLKKDSKTSEVVRDLLGKPFEDFKFEELEKENMASVVAMGLYYKYRVERNKKVNIKKTSAAQIWKTYYNTVAGAGTVDGFNKVVKQSKKIIDVAYDAIKLDRADIIKIFTNPIKAVKDAFNISYKFNESVTDKLISLENQLAFINFNTTSTIPYKNPYGFAVLEKERTFTDYINTAINLNNVAIEKWQEDLTYEETEVIIS